MNELNLKAIADAVHEVAPDVPVPIDCNAELQADLGIDSIMMVELLILLEEQFDFEFDNMDLLMDNFLNISTICKFLESKYLR